MSGDVRGTGIYIYKLPAGGGEDPGKLVKRLKAANVARIYVKVADGADVFPRIKPDYNKAVIAEARKQGLSVWGWHYIYGNFPEAEADRAAELVTKFGLQFYIYNAEKHHYGRAKQAKTFIERLRKNLPNTKLGFSSFKYPTYHPELPWKTFAAAAHFLMPQVYWVEAHNPEKQYDRSWKEWSVLNPKAVMLPTGAAYSDDPEKWVPNADEMSRFLRHVHAKGCAGADFWVWDYVAKPANAELLAAITAFTWAAAENATAAAPAAVLATAPSGADLKPDEHIPAKRESAVCGPIAKRITRADPEFALLVRNDNPQIVFKNEESTAADRTMTANLRAKLDALAALVQAEWKNTKLRVTEAWDENDLHTPRSLHFEGRAADLTTHPRNTARLGRLGRLAVDAGCDWVLHEGDHIHVSVKK
ncbi:MAG TPA: hypothetical protein VF618_12350 [Thermoanaerobaculia bacterium]